MNRMALLVILLVLAASAARPQSPAPSPPAVVSPEVRADRSVVFRLWAPKAAEVTVTGSFWLQEGRTEKLTRGEKGIWSYTTEPLPPDYYSYWFTVDGVRVTDPVNGRIKPGSARTSSAFSISGPESSFLEANPVPHGEVRIVFYQSSVTGSTRRMHVYLPPGYETGQARYPVVYLMHGGGDTDDGWTAIGRVNFMLDNLISQGRAVPMVVAMPSLWVLDPSTVREQADRDRNLALFQKDLVEEIVPHVERNYRVRAGAENRALGGLGVRRDFMPNVLLSTLGTFGHVFHTSGGMDPEWLPLLEQKYPGRLSDPANVRSVRFFVGSGTHDHSNPSARFWVEALRARGYAVEYHQSEGIHEWPWFRRYFAEFAQVAFR